MSVHIYILGVPIDTLFEKQTVISTYTDFLRMVKTRAWPVFASSAPGYFKAFAPDGWDILEKMDVQIKQVKVIHKTRPEFLEELANSVIRLATNSSSPIVFLRPGNPEIGDVPVEKIIQAFRNDPTKVCIINARSGPDIVADYAEKILNLGPLSRQHFSAKQFLCLTSRQQLTAGLILIRSLSHSYDDDGIGLFARVLEKIVVFGMDQNYVYIKSPTSRGFLTTVSEIFKTKSIFELEAYYTLILLNH